MKLSSNVNNSPWTPLFDWPSTTFLWVEWSDALANAISISHSICFPEILKLPSNWHIESLSSDMISRVGISWFYSIEGVLVLVLFRRSVSYSFIWPWRICIIGEASRFLTFPRYDAVSTVTNNDVFLTIKLWSYYINGRQKYRATLSVVFAKLNA